MRKRCAGLAPEDDVSASARSKLAMPAHEVGVKVGLDDVPDLEALRFRLGDVLIDIALWVDHCRFTIRAYQVGRVRETTKVKLLEVHNRLLVLTLLKAPVNWYSFKTHQSRCPANTARGRLVANV
jgi:hypothetical protein